MENFLEKIHRFKIKASLLQKLPETAGVYIFLNSVTPIYIGKAINIKRRVGSYFDLDLSTKTAKMVAEATDLSFIRVTSELESLLLEARLIRKFMPHYNIASKDDKHPLYIIITKEEFPRVITGRKTDIEKLKTTSVFGPFPSSSNVRLILKWLRRIFPYSDHKIGKRGCLYSHLGLCNPCPSDIQNLDDSDNKVILKKTYIKNIQHITSILGGRSKHVKTVLAKEMQALSATLQYEKAKAVRDQINKLEYITATRVPTEYFLEDPNLYEDLRKNELSELKAVLKKFDINVTKLFRIECYDVAHLSGTKPTASMVTFIDGEKEAKFYRHFHINQDKGASDIDSMHEVIIRRKKHFKDWGRPDLIIVDGGKAQVSVFLNELINESIPVVGLAKRFETLVIPTQYLGTKTLREYKLPNGPALNLVQRIRDEAHRFARRYHHKLLSKSIYAKAA